MRLTKEAFDKQYRFRECRSPLWSARCEICTHCVGGDCTHPDRVRKVGIFEYYPNVLNSKGTRIDVRKDRVCDQVQISMPEHVKEPELASSIAILSHSLIHGNPLCPHLAATVRQHGLREIVSAPNCILNVSLTQSSPFNLCDLPGCTDRLGIEQGQPDQYLRRLHLDDGYVPPPPKPTYWDLPDPDLVSEGMESTVRIFTDGAHITWTDEMAQMGIRIVKALMKQHFDPSRWVKVAQVLRAAGWGEIVDMICYEIAVMEEQIYCVSCGLSNRKGRIEKPTRVGGEPICPVCGDKLTYWSCYIGNMPQ